MYKIDPMTIEAFIRSLPPEERVPTLIDAYREITGQTDDILTEAKAFKLTPTQTIIFGLLRKRLGQVVTRNAVFTAYNAVNRETTSDQTLDVHVWQMRRKLAGKYKIKGIYGTGWIMTLT